jgi:hypothetical protein
MVQVRGGTTLERTAPRRLTKREIDRRIAEIGAEVVRAFEGEETERIEYLGEEIFPLPMDTKMFIRIMSRHLSFN